MPKSEAASMTTWRLVLIAVTELLHSGSEEFTLHEVVTTVQRKDPARDRTTIQPTVQGMTVNAGTGPPSPCGKPLERIRHGVYAVRREVGRSDLIKLIS